MAYFIVNRRARSLRDDGPLLREQCRARATVEVIETRSLADLEAAAKRIASAPAPVILGGGDGTHGAGITALWRAFGDRELPPIGLAPGGTVNTVAKAWGMRGNPVASTRRLLDAVEANTAAQTRRPTLVIDPPKIDGLNNVPSDRDRSPLPPSPPHSNFHSNSHFHSHPHSHFNSHSNLDPISEARSSSGSASASASARLSASEKEEGLKEKEEGLREKGLARLGFIVGAGLVSRFFEIYDAAGASGLGSAARITGRLFAESFVGGALARRVLTPAPCKLLVDGVPAPFDELSLLCASVVDDVGLGLRLLYRAAEAHDRFHVVATPLGPRRLGPQMPRVLAGLPLRGTRVDALARSVELRFPDGTGAYVIDGELVRSDHVRIGAGPVITVLEA